MIHFLFSFLSVVLAVKIMGVAYFSWKTLLIFTLFLAIVNGVVKPVLNFLTWPINFLTLGLFHLILNILLLMIISKLTPNFVDFTFLQAAIFGLIYGAIQWVFSKFDL
ncbi:MAG: phage holin family protein [Candidatus Paceibacterota bacterium]|jgi:putative membrane protein